jgi:hypothetical protein
MRNVSDKFMENIKTRILFSVPPFLFENHAVYEIMLKNIVLLDRPQLKTQLLLAPLCILDDKGYIHTHTHTHRIRNTYCFSTAKVVTRTRLDVKLYVHCLLCHSRFSVSNDALSIQNT